MATAFYNQGEGRRFRGGDKFANKQKRDWQESRAPFSRLFVICGKQHGAEDLREAFKEYGTIENVYVVKDRTTNEHRGIAYIQYQKMSEACIAIERLHGKRLNQYDSAPLKVIMSQPKDGGEQKDESELTRLFVSVPKRMQEGDLKQAFSEFGDVDYVSLGKDHITGENKGFGFVKYHRPYEAAKAIEDSDKSFKAVLAEPKASKKKREMVTNDTDSHPPLMGVNVCDWEYGGGQGSDFVDSMQKLPPLPSFGFDDGLKGGGIGNRLQVTCALDVTGDELARLFDLIPGMEFCDLKRDFSTGESKGVAVVVYNSVGSATYAKEKLNGFEYPRYCKLTVCYAPDGQGESMSNEIENRSLVPRTGNTPVGDGSYYCSVELPPAKPLARTEEVAERLFIVCRPTPLPQRILDDVFSRFGDLIDVFIIKDKTFGYARYASCEAADKAMQALHGADICGSTLVKVAKAEPKTKEESDRKRPRT